MQEVQKQALEKSQQPANELPHEVLSQIFVLCKDKERKQGYPDTFQQAVLPVICRYWRKVALDTKELWSLITLPDSPPFEYSRLFLERSGTTAPLDLEIRLSKRFWRRSNDPTTELYTEGMLEALNFIVENGGATYRWRSFWLYTPVDTHLNPQYTALDFLQNRPLESLERFEIKHDGLYYATTPRNILGDRIEKTLFADCCPKLRVITIEQLPFTYLYSSTNHTRLVGLTRLEILFPVDLPHPRQINETLAAIPALTALSMDTRKAHFGLSNTDINNQTYLNLPKIYMPNLRALGLMFTANDYLALWEYTLLLTLNAPDVQNLRFHLDSGASETSIRYFIKYFVQGADSVRPTPLFSHLTGLDIFVPHESDSTHADPQEELLAAYPGLTNLALRLNYKQPTLTLQSWLVPLLNRLFIRAQSPSELKKVIAPRYAAGMGPRVAEVPLLSKDTKSMEAEYREAFYGSGVEVCLSSWGCWKHRIREALGFEDA